MTVVQRRFACSSSPEKLAYAETVVNRAGILDEETAKTLGRAFAIVPRELFLEKRYAEHAYEDISLPIGYNQVSSKPSLVARMMGLLGLKKGMKILQIGCGSGYSSALMAAVGAKVFAVEGIGLLAQSTRRRLDSLYFHDVIVQRGDGKRGWEEHAPFDAILVSCAVPEVGRELMSQLIKPTGRLVAPIGTEESQTLTLFEVRPGGIATYQLEPCSVEEDTSEERAER